MFSIKRSYADCSSCDLLMAPSCILETNSEKNLMDVDIVFVSENPGKNEIKKEVPLIGRAGQTFRKYFNRYIKKNFKWVLTNCVLCATITEDGKTGNPKPDVIEHCKENCFEIIRACNPKLIVLMGSSPMYAFGIAKSGITNLRGQLFKWEGFDVLITVHPSFVNRNRTFTDKFESDIIKASEILGLEVSVDEIEKNVEREKGKHYYKIPEKYYTDQYRLVDIQHLSGSSTVLYIFRDKDNKKEYYKTSDEYVAYNILPGKEARKLVPYDHLEQVRIPYKQKTRLDPYKTYEGDMRITVKHAFDYYHFNIEEAERISFNILYADIEVDTGEHNRVFPNPTNAKYPINMITIIYNDNKICYVVDPKRDKITDKPGVELKIFQTEKSMMGAFIMDLMKFDPDFMAGWHFIGFDMEYIYNRLPKIGIPQNKLSRFGSCYVDGNRYICHIPGVVVLDQLFLYRNFTFTKKENYKLDFIAQEELDGFRKVELEMPINEMYYKDVNKLIEYNIRDSELLERLESQLKHINLLNELRTICKSSFDGTSSPFGQVDSIMVSFLREKGIASINSDPHIEKKKYPGAYVHPPKPAIYNYITDFDFTSLYPSIIMTYNIGVNNYVMKLADGEKGFELAYDLKELGDDVPVIIDPTCRKEQKIIKKQALLQKIEEENLIHTINGCFFKPHNEEVSVYSQVLQGLLSARKKYKGMMFEAKTAGHKELKDLYNTRQLVYKVLANSLYGVVANKAFRFFDLDCAAAITLGGQEALKHSITHGDSYMKFLKDGEDKLVDPEPLTKRELFDDKMPNRVPEFIVTGDTDSIFTCFEKFPGEKTEEKILGWCKKIQTYLNNDIMKQIVQRHNVQVENSKLDLKNELIIDRGLFLAKKRYVIHVTNNEGRQVDDTNYMGIEVKRSDFPSASKEFMKELLDIILKTENITLTKLFRFIDGKRRNFVKLIKDGDKSIGRPVSYGKRLSDYKTIPQGVRGMEAFNNISYRAHQVGARGYLFRVAGFDQDKAPKEVVENFRKHILEKGNKLDVIAIPDEEPCLPPYYIPDVKANLKFVFEDRIDLLLEPLTKAKQQQEIMTF